jgi:hypothetical protein
VNEMATIEIYNDTLKLALINCLERSPTEQEMQDFAEYLKVDIWDWIKENAKSFSEKKKKGDK